MKYIATILLFFLFSCGAREPNNKLPAFNLTYISGCNAITRSKISIYYKDDKYFADHTSPTYFDGNNTDSLWTIELNTKQIDACIKFLDNAKSLPRKCDQFSSSENHHIIIINKDTIDINGDCDWNNLDFQFLDQQLFKTKHSEIEEKKKIFLENLDKKLTGKWFLQPSNKDLKRDDILTFSRSKITNNFIVFGDKNILTGNCIDLLKMKNLKRYKTELSDGWNETVINLDWGKVTLEKEYNIWYEFGATFTLESITQDELKVNFLWTNN